MLQAWLLFKGMETIIGTFCLYYHALSFMNDGEFPHTLLYCGTFFGFTLLSFVTAIGISVGNAPPPFFECTVNFCGALMYFSCSLVAMYYIEIDFHMMYLSDFEEPLHPFFIICKKQSICALVAGFIHFLHSSFAFDAIISLNYDSESYDSYSQDDQLNDELAKGPIKLYFLSKIVEDKLRQNKWFDSLCKRRVDTVSFHSSFRKFKSYYYVPERQTVAESFINIQDLESQKRTKKKKRYWSNDSTESDISEVPIVQYLSAPPSMEKITGHTQVKEADKTITNDINEHHEPRNQPLLPSKENVLPLETEVTVHKIPESTESPEVAPSKAESKLDLTTDSFQTASSSFEELSDKSPEPGQQSKTTEKPPMGGNDASTLQTHFKVEPESKNDNEELEKQQMPKSDSRK